MAEALQTGLLSAEEAVQQASSLSTPNGLRYATLGRLDGPNTSAGELQHLVGAVPAGLARGLERHLYLFVPLALSAARLKSDDAQAFSENDETLIASAYSGALADKAICHRNARVGDTEYVFLSSRLHADRFALAFEFCINVAHNFVDTTGCPAEFAALVWKQVTAGVRGETSIDAWEERAAALGQPATDGLAKDPALVHSGRVNEKARTDYETTAFADALAIYLLSLTLDFEYADLREREYPLLTAPALAERLRAINRLFPPNDGYQFQILYRKRM